MTVVVRLFGLNLFEMGDNMSLNTGKYRRFGMAGREEPNADEAKFLNTLVSLDKGITVFDVLKRMLAHESVIGLQIYGNLARIDTCYVDDMDELICLYMLKNECDRFDFADADSLDHFISEKFAEIGDIAAKRGLILREGWIYSEVDIDNIDGQIADFINFWREIEIIH